MRNRQGMILKAQSIILKAPLEHVVLRRAKRKKKKLNFFVLCNIPLSSKPECQSPWKTYFFENIQGKENAAHKSNRLLHNGFKNEGKMLYISLLFVTVKKIFSPFTISYMYVLPCVQQVKSTTNCAV